MVKNLDHLLPLHAFLNKAVEAAHVRLLLGEIGVALFAAVPQEDCHARKGGDHHQAEDVVEDEEHREGADDHHRVLYEGGEAVVEGFGDGVDVVGEPAHQLAVGFGVEIAQRELLEMIK